MQQSMQGLVDLVTMLVEFTVDGAIVPAPWDRAVPPDVAGRLVGEACMTQSPPHAGEMHADGDELLYLIEGAVDVILDGETGDQCFALQPLQAFIVPRGVWHRVVVKEPCRLLHFTPGKKQVRWSRPA